ncbi:hypothetical protein [Sorangium sp. So ce1097]|uniref:hypothetical protein n=1 Tax=Sorangium sp. So ce1097 TaxID=3133330 RepID=UPI003F60817E
MAAPRAACVAGQMADARRVLDQLGRELDTVHRPRRRPSAPLLVSRRLPSPG